MRTKPRIPVGGIKAQTEDPLAFYRFLIKSGFPTDDYRLLCMNCNFAIGKFGVCPHQVVGR